MSSFARQDLTRTPARFVVGAGAAGQRLDLFLALDSRLQDITRSRIKTLISDGHVLVNGQRRKASYTVQPQDSITVVLPEPQQTELVPEKISFPVLFEDDDLIVISKPPGMVVHPACGHNASTLVHGLLFHCRDLSGISGELRPGIVHRLDKDTSGVMVIAKNDAAHHALVEQFKGRTVEKIYHAILDGTPASPAGRIAQPIGRHPVHRKKMAIRENGRTAVTNWQVIEAFAVGLTFVEISLETGRTHQIRVHMASLGCPVAGDPVYGKKNKQYQSLQIERQCLHASTLSFIHPRSHEKMRFTAPLWPDLENTLQLLRVI